MRKKSVGEAKGSNAEAGEVKRCCSRECRAWVVHVEFGFVSCFEVGDGDGDEREGIGEVTMSVQSNTAFFVTNPTIFVSWDREEMFSVSAREVASVPPRKEP